MHSLSRKTLVMFILGLCCCGCFVGSREQQQEDEAYVAEEHLHHELPEHMPHDFPDAIREIEQRDGHLRKELAAERFDHAQQELTELLDIIGWLPDLAADSDLRKQEWEQVRDNARTLEMLYQPLRQLGQAQAFLKNGQSEETMKAILSEFQTLSEKYPDGFETVLGGHDHDHHDH